MSTLLLLALIATPCEPHVDLVGDVTLVRHLKHALQNSGEGFASTCPALRVELQRRDGSIFVAIEETSGRKVARTVQDPDLLVPLIESWLYADLADSLLVPPRPPPLIETSDPARIPPPLPDPEGRLLEVGALLEFGWAEAAGGELSLAIVSALRLGWRGF